MNKPILGQIFEQVIKTIGEGYRTSKEISNFLGISRAKVSSVLVRLKELNNYVERYRLGKYYHYQLLKPVEEVINKMKEYYKDYNKKYNKTVKYDDRRIKDKLANLRIPEELWAEFIKKYENASYRIRELIKEDLNKEFLEVEASKPILIDEEVSKKKKDKQVDDLEFKKQWEAIHLGMSMGIGQAIQLVCKSVSGYNYVDVGELIHKLQEYKINYKKVSEKFNYEGEKK
jgi:hypothetical protein